MRKFSFSRTEIREILISTAVLSAAFAVAFSNGILNISIEQFPVMILFSFISVGIGFLAHELIGHKLIAQYFDLFAEYRMWKNGLVLALLSSLAGFVFAAPGAVMISRSIDLWGSHVPVTKKRMGIIAMMGPVVNLVLGAVFFVLNALAPSSLFTIAMQVNIWLALFNMLPVPPLDGSKILAWDKRIWAGLFAVLIAAFFFL
ncbi:MAG: M50 family metallopeptidase [Candidatus Aenigmarchaeota archaeon]|nr:M50 family metallopeptidase [Candidatus Aenigmarchaeota archaeon]